MEPEQWAEFINVLSRYALAMEQTHEQLVKICKAVERVDKRQAKWYKEQKEKPPK